MLHPIQDVWDVPLYAYPEWSAKEAKAEREGVAPRLVVLPRSFRAFARDTAPAAAAAFTQVGLPAVPAAAAPTPAPPPAPTPVDKPAEAVPTPEPADKPAEAATPAAPGVQGQKQPPEPAAAEPPPVPAAAKAQAPEPLRPVHDGATGVVTRAESPLPSPVQEVPQHTSLWHRLRAKFGTGEPNRREGAETPADKGSAAQ